MSRESLGSMPEGGAAASCRCVKGGFQIGVPAAPSIEPVPTQAKGSINGAFGRLVRSGEFEKFEGRCHNTWRERFLGFGFLICVWRRRRAHQAHKAGKQALHVGTARQTSDELWPMNLQAIVLVSLFLAQFAEYPEQFVDGDVLRDQTPKRGPEELPRELCRIGLHEIAETLKLGVVRDSPQSPYAVNQRIVIGKRAIHSFQRDI